MERSPDVLSSLQAARAELARRSLIEYVRQAWHVVEPSTEHIHGWHIDAMCEHLEAITRGEIRNLLINIPPRHMKSLLVCVFWPTWEWIDNPAGRWMFATYKQDYTVRDSLKCRRVIESPWYQKNWGTLFQITSDQNQKMRFENDKTGIRIAISVGGGTGEGGDKLIIDDPHDMEKAESDISRQAVLDWYDHVWITRVNDPKTVAKVIIMQRLHQQDLSGHVLEQGGWEHLCLPFEYEGQLYSTSRGDCDKREETGVILWPERFGPKEVEGFKLMGPYMRSGQLQQRPSPAEGGILKRWWWRYWHNGSNPGPVAIRTDDGNPVEIKAQELPEKFDEIIQSWDMAFKDAKESSYVVGQVWGRKGADKYLLDQRREKLDFPATMNAVKAMAVKWPDSRRKLVEDKANGPAVIAMLKHDLSGLIEVKPEGGKEARANAAAPQIESGNVYLPHPGLHPWAADLIEECAAFPNAAYDDQVDAMTQALNWMQAHELGPGILFVGGRN